MDRGLYSFNSLVVQSSRASSDRHVFSHILKVDFIAQVPAQTHVDSATPGKYFDVAACKNEAVGGLDRAPESTNSSDTNLAIAKPDYHVGLNCQGPRAPLTPVWSSMMAP